MLENNVTAAHISVMGINDTQRRAKMAGPGSFPGRVSGEHCWTAISGLALALGISFLVVGCGGPQMPGNGPVRTLAPVAATSKPYRISNSFYQGRLFVPQPHYELVETGIASCYGDGDGEHLGPTATGQRYDKHQVTAAHRTLPLPCVILVENLDNGKSVRLLVNDRGPFAKERVLDVSVQAAKILGFHRQGTARVRLSTLVPESRLVADAFHAKRRNASTPADRTLVAWNSPSPLSRRPHSAKRHHAPMGLKSRRARAVCVALNNAVPLQGRWARGRPTPPQDPTISDRLGRRQARINNLLSDLDARTP